MIMCVGQTKQFSTFGRYIYLFQERQSSSRGRDKKDDVFKTTIALLGSRTKMFFLEFPGSYYFVRRDNVEFQFIVRSSVRMTWAIGCPESHFYQIPHHPTSSPTVATTSMFCMHSVFKLLSFCYQKA